MNDWENTVLHETPPPTAASYIRSDFLEWSNNKMFG